MNLSYAPRNHLTRLALSVILALFFFSGRTPAVAQETLPPATLEAPPLLHADAGQTHEQPDCTQPDNARAHPLICASEKASATRSASARNGYLTTAADMPYPQPAPVSSKKVHQVITTAQKEESEWKMGVELRNSPVTEAHGNAERLESVGGLIKGSLKF